MRSLKGNPQRIMIQYDVTVSTGVNLCDPRNSWHTRNKLHPWLHPPDAAFSLYLTGTIFCYKLPFNAYHMKSSDLQWSQPLKVKVS